MKINKLILKHFSFLLNYGFQLECDALYNIIYTYSFINTNDCKVIVSIDLREDFVDIKVKRTTKVLLAVEYGKVIENHKFSGLKEMLNSVENIYNEAKKSRRGFSKVHIDEVLALYAKFILANFENITETTQQNRRPFV